MQSSQIALSVIETDHGNYYEWAGKTSINVPWQIFQGDALSVLANIPDNSVDCVVTSPPYYWLRDYGVEGQIGMENTVEEYVTSINLVMTEIRRILTKTGILFLNIGDTYYSGKGESQGKDLKSRKRRFGLRAVDKSGGLGIGLQPKTLIGIPWRVVLAMTSNRWILRSAIIWHRRGRLREAAKDRPGRSYEYVFMFTKSRKYYFNREALVDQHIEEDMWSIVPRSKSSNIDTAPFPDELVKRCLDIGCPPQGVVLDPFGGSGTTLKVALESGRSAIAVDLNHKFCEYMVNTVQEL